MGLIILTLLGLKYLPGWVKLVWLFHLSLPHLNVDFSREDIAKIEKAMRGASSIEEREERGRCLVKLAHAQYPGYDDNATQLSTLQWKVEQVARGENWQQQHQSRGRGWHL